MRARTKVVYAFVIAAPQRSRQWYHEHECRDEDTKTPVHFGESQQRNDGRRCHATECDGSAPAMGVG